METKRQRATQNVLWSCCPKHVRCPRRTQNSNHTPPSALDNCRNGSERHPWWLAGARALLGTVTGTPTRGSGTCWLHRWGGCQTFCSLQFELRNLLILWLRRLNFGPLSTLRGPNRHTASHFKSSTDRSPLANLSGSTPSTNSPPKAVDHLHRILIYFYTIIQNRQSLHPNNFQAILRVLKSTKHKPKKSSRAHNLNTLPLC